ncbi:MAG: ATP-binding protein, partial [Elusimicrobia bacterium]|nr:ATP-binding protein [Elusimicrobiota bacterium]
MAQLEASLKEFSLVLERKDLEEVFSRLGGERDWHRLAERLSQFSKVCRPLGVDLVLRRDKRDLRVYFGSLENLHAVIRALAERRGYVQKSFAAMLQTKSAHVVDRGCLPPKLREVQAAILKDALSRDLGVFGRLDIDDVLVDVPSSAGGRDGTLFSAVAGAMPSSLLVTGDGGSGKTALLYKLLSRWTTLGRRVAGRFPVYLPAKHLHFEWGKFDAAWEVVPGVEPYMIERLSEAFAAGRLVLLLDGLDENPACTDFTNPAVLSFWRAAARNACVVTLLSGYYEGQLKIAPLEGLFGGRLRRLSVPAWGTAQYRELFENIACAAGRPKDSSLSSLAGYLNKLSADEWQKQSNLLRFTPLTGLACANFFASNHGARLPKNEYELMEHMTAFRLQHEGLKGTSALSQQDAFGLLMKLAWRAYADGTGAKSYILPLDAAVRIVKDHYPFLEERSGEALSALSHLPCLEYSPANTAVFMNQQFTDYLVARRVLHAFLHGDYKARREVMSISWQYRNMSRSYFQGIRCLNPAEKSQFFEVSRATFRAVWQEYLVERTSALGVALAYILQPLGFLGTEGALGFLRWVYEQAEGKGEFVLMSCAIGGGWGGDPTNLERYVTRMRRDKEAG